MIAESYSSQKSPTRSLPLPYRLPGTRKLATAVGLALGLLTAVLLRPSSGLAQSGIVLLVLAVVYVGVPLVTAVRKTPDTTPDWGLALMGQGVGVTAVALLFFSTLISF